MYIININITKHVLQSELENEKPTLCCCFTWMLFIELNFTVAFMLIRKTWEDRFADKLAGWGILKNGGMLVMGDDFEMGV